MTPKGLTMNSDLLQKFLSKTGQICSVTWQRPCKTYKGETRKVEKRVSAVVRAGVNFDAMASVKEKRENGELPPENTGLPWGEWFVFPYIIAHKGDHYLRFSHFPGGKLETHFFLDGKEVNKGKLREICLASEFTERESLDCFNVRASSILSLV
jgi:hypothetical protein